nr:hypothetical protein [uncultured Carboxylicivirga sp.]
MANEILKWCDTRSYLIVRCDDEYIPSTKIDEKRRGQLVKLKEVFPYLLHEEKRENRTLNLSVFRRLITNSNYSFAKSKEGTTVWIDYWIEILPLLLALMRKQPEVSFQKLMDEIIEKRDIDVNSCEYAINFHRLSSYIQIYEWGSFEDLVHRKANDLLELIDYFYDEIKMTHLHPKSYQALFHLFGEATIDIGYAAFDLYNQTRNSETAWQEAIKTHLCTYHIDELLKETIWTMKVAPILEFN